MPWMCYEEIEIIENILQRLQPRHCLEWGTGYSTVYFSRFLPRNSLWISVDHDKNWELEIDNFKKDLNTKVFCVPPNHYPWTDNNNDGAYADLVDYIEFPRKFAKFDFILIDGRGRKDCLIKANELITEKGIIVLHDAEREYYQEPFRLFKYQILMGGYNRNGSMLWVGSRGYNVDIMLNFSRYKKLWFVYRKLKQVLRVTEKDITRN